MKFKLDLLSYIIEFLFLKGFKIVNVRKIRFVMKKWRLVYLFINTKVMEFFLFLVFK